MSTCTYCGKELSGLKHIKHVTYFELYGREFCFECYGYAAMFCTSPDDIDRFTIEELKAICNHDDCDICGKKPILLKLPPVWGQYYFTVVL